MGHILFKPHGHTSIQHILKILIIVLQGPHLDKCTILCGFIVIYYYV